MTTATAERLPAAQAWHTASYRRPCPTCDRDIGRHDRVALVVGVDPYGEVLPLHVCADCTSSPKPRRTR